MKFNPGNTVVQLWHAPGAFKKFGGSVDFESRPGLKKAGENTDFLIISSKIFRIIIVKHFKYQNLKLNL